MATRLKRYSTSFKFILLLAGLIFAGYIFKVTSTGPKWVVSANTVVTVQPLKKHKVKTNLLVAAPIQASADTPHTVPVKAIRPKTEQTEPVMIAAKPTVIKKTIDTVVQPKSNYLYTTYMHAKVTGAVKLKDRGNYYANTLADIPANSKVQVLKKGATYYQVAYNNTVGYVPRWALQNK